LPPRWERVKQKVKKGKEKEKGREKGWGGGQGPKKKIFGQDLHCLIVLLKSYGLV
jgi:hypothetical protein